MKENSVYSVFSRSVTVAIRPVSMELPWVAAASGLGQSPARGTPKWSQGTLVAYLQLGIWYQRPLH